MKVKLLVLAGVAGLSICATAPRALAQDAAAKPRYGSFGLELQLMDRSVKPGDSFFDYALGTWLRDYPIPADKTAAG